MTSSLVSSSLHKDMKQHVSLIKTQDLKTEPVEPKIEPKEEFMNNSSPPTQSTGLEIPVTRQHSVIARPSTGVIRSGRPSVIQHGQSYAR